MVRDNRHDSAYIFGAICPARAVGAAVLMPAANTEAMNEHLKEISTQVAPGPEPEVGRRSRWRRGSWPGRWCERLAVRRAARAVDDDAGAIVGARVGSGSPVIGTQPVFCGHCHVNLAGAA
jgi:hypothetical protein